MKNIEIVMRSLYQDTFGTTMSPTKEELLWIKEETERINSKKFIVENKKDLLKFKKIGIKTKFDINNVEYLINDFNDVINFAKAYSIKIKEYKKEHYNNY